MKKQLLRDTKKGLIAGVCAGLGEYFNISPWIFRVLFILPVLPTVLNFLSGVASIVLYVALALFIPSRKLIDEREVVEVDYEIIDEAEEAENTGNAENTENFEDVEDAEEVEDVEDIEDIEEVEEAEEFCDQPKEKGQR